MIYFAFRKGRNGGSRLGYSDGCLEGEVLSGINTLPYRLTSVTHH